MSGKDVQKPHLRPKHMPKPTVVIHLFSPSGGVVDDNTSLWLYYKEKLAC